MVQVGLFDSPLGQDDGRILTRGAQTQHEKGEDEEAAAAADSPAPVPTVKKETTKDSKATRFELSVPRFLLSHFKFLTPGKA